MYISIRLKFKIIFTTMNEYDNIIIDTDVTATVTIVINHTIE